MALGSNLGDRETHLLHAIDRLRESLGDVRVSRFVDTDPVDVDPQPVFLNAALLGTTALAPVDFLQLLLTIERERGRVRPYAGAPRTLDLDLVLYADRVLKVEGLEVPHPRFRERRFVLEPLAEIAPGLKDPVTGRTMAELLRDLDSRG